MLGCGRVCVGRSDRNAGGPSCSFLPYASGGPTPSGPMDLDRQSDAETWRHLVRVSYPAVNAGRRATAKECAFLEKSRRCFALYQIINACGRLPESLLPELDELIEWLARHYPRFIHQLLLWSDWEILDQEQRRELNGGG